jgi:hypothetical protein
MPMNKDILDKLIWICIYGGLLALCLGLFVQRQAGVFGGVLIAGGAAVAAVGVYLVWLRSRRGP